MTNSAEEILGRYGWSFHDKCRCGGTLKYKYRKKELPGLEITWMVTSRLFSVKNKGKTVTRATRIDKLEETLKTIDGN